MLRITMPSERRIAFAASVALLALTLGAWQNRASGAVDPLAAEIERWSAYLSGNASTDELWKQIKPDGQLAVERTERALRAGHRLLALMRLGSMRESLAAAAYMLERPADQLKDTAAFEAEWGRMGSVLGEDLRTPPSSALEGARPAAVRAIGEAARHQVKVYYEASLEYGRNTQPQNGLFYLGAAQAQGQFAAFCSTLDAPSRLAAPPLRPLGTELDALEAELLAAYRPPASIDKHREFIIASSMLKEARELDAAGLRHGALLRYLLAAMRAAPLLPPSSLAPPALAERLRQLDQRLASGGRDLSLGRLFLEVAQDDVAAAAPGQSASTAVAVVSDVLPRYFAALEPAKPEPPRPAPRVTVTLVRWPYT